MLKTISYSIVFFSKKILDIENSKKNNEKIEIKNSDYFFACIDSWIEIQKIFQKIFGNEISVKKENLLFVSKYISSNNYSVSFETPFSFNIKIEKDEKNKELQERQEKDIQKIAEAIIKTIKEFYNYKNDIVAYIETNYVFLKKDAKKKIKDFYLIKNKDIEMQDVKLLYPQEEYLRLKLKLEDEGEKDILIKANVKVSQTTEKTFEDILSSNDVKDYICKEIEKLEI